MPKKTRKEKLRADHNRKTSTVRVSGQPQPNPSQITTPSASGGQTPVFSFQFTGKNTAPSSPKQAVNNHIARDLFKTVILAAIAIASEVTLSFILK